MDFAHIKTIKNPEDNKQQPDLDSPDFIRKTSFAAETEAKFEDISPSNLPSISTLSGNIQGGTFAQRARAAELQAARARTELKSKDPQASSSPPHPRRLLTLKMPRRQKWAPLDLTKVPDVESSNTTPEVNQNANVTDQLAEGDGPLVDQEIREHEAMYANLHPVGNSNQSQRMDHLAARLYGSRPTTALQSHDLKEYPAELGARIENSLPAPLSNGDRGMISQNGASIWAPTPQESASIQERFPSNQQNTAEQNHGFHACGRQGLVNTDFTSASLSLVEKEVLQSFANNYRAHGPQFLVENNVHGGDVKQSSALNDPFNVAPPKLNTNKSYTAVRGTPAALNSNNTRLTPMNPAANTFYSNRVQGHTARKPSDQEREFLVRHLNMVVDENTGVQAQHFGHDATTHSTQPPDGTVNVQPLLYGSYAIPQPRQFSGTISQNDPFEEKPPLYPHRTGIWAPDKHYLASNPDTSESKQASEPTKEEKRARLEKEVADWWVADNRVPVREKTRVQEALLVERYNERSNPNRFNLDDYDDYDEVVQAMAKDPTAPYKNEDMVNDLLAPVIATLTAYKSDRPGANPFSKPPSWAIDHTPGGNNSFFSQQWGTPPQRVGRDPRYRAMQHDGRSSVFEDPTGRHPREEFSHARGRRTFQNDKFNMK